MKLRKNRGKGGKNIQNAPHKVNHCPSSGISVSWGTMRPIVAAILFLTLASCRGTNRADASGDEEKFAQVYARLVLISSDPQAGSGTTPEQILKGAGMTQEEFRRRVAEYNRDPQRWGALIEKVQKIVEEEVARKASPPSSPGVISPSPGGATSPSRTADSGAVSASSNPGQAASGR
jgi:hypothetical protein